jgi:hypothetical protein
MAVVLQLAILRRVRHSRMLLAGIQAEFGLDPRLKHSGVTVLGVASRDCRPQFSKERTNGTKGSESDIFEFLNFVVFVTFVVQ